LFLKVTSAQFDEQFSTNLPDAIPYAVAWRGSRCVVVGMAESGKTPTKNAFCSTQAGGLDAYLLVADFPP
jgi:hypothetical protein